MHTSTFILFTLLYRQSNTRKDKTIRHVTFAKTLRVLCDCANDCANVVSMSGGSMFICEFYIAYYIKSL